MIKELDNRKAETAREILNVQLASYQIEAELVGFYDLPPLKDSIETLQKCGEQFCGYYEGEVLAGALSFKVEGRELDLCRMMVHPDYFRRGIAQKLLDHLFSLNPGAASVIVSTGFANVPAISLYEKNGFVHSHDIPINNSFKLSFFKKSL